jgi:hypothetical protein
VRDRLSERRVLMDKKKDTCGSCYFCFSENTGDYTVKRACHRNPPTVRANGLSQFPEVNEKDWCGEHVSPVDVAANRLMASMPR